MNTMQLLCVGASRMSGSGQKGAYDFSKLYTMAKGEEKSGNPMIESAGYKVGEVGCDATCIAALKLARCTFPVVVECTFEMKEQQGAMVPYVTSVKPVVAQAAPTVSKVAG